MTYKRKRAPADKLEAQVQNEIVEMAERLGLKTYTVNKTYSPTQSYTTPGFSDLVHFGHGKIIFNEVKLSYNEPSVAQEEFQRLVVGNGGYYIVTHSPEEFLFAGRNLGMWR